MKAFHDGLFYATAVAPDQKLIPEPVWLSSSYLPNYEDAHRFDLPIMTNSELVKSYMDGDVFVFDIESYPNYFLAAFKNVKTGKYVLFEDSETRSFDPAKLKWMLENCNLISFNGIKYDWPVTTIAANGASCAELFSATERIISDGVAPWMLLKSMRVKQIQGNHIDLIEVAPLQGSLKIYAARANAPTIQDLPYQPGTVLTPEQIECVRWYCCASDIPATERLLGILKPQLELRMSMSKEYGTDLRSKSDAQIAEAVISHELWLLHGEKPTVPDSATIPPTCRYVAPEYVQYQTQQLRDVLDLIHSEIFCIGESGAVTLPDSLKGLKITINNGTYQMGIGGLHSCESARVTKADDNHILVDRDVTSYYPSMILNMRLFPKQLGSEFLEIYQSIVDRRIAAKHAGDKITADSLKIVINGSFGKFGSKYSALYSPQLLIQTTITGQLLLLMFIEALEISGIPVVSANTDGIVIHCPKNKTELMERIVKWWERTTGLNTEDTHYSALYSRDVNNYLAAKIDGGYKGKGIFTLPKDGSADALKKNQDAPICVQAVAEYLVNGTPIEKTINDSTDFTRFVVVRTVKGHGVKLRANGQHEYMGKTCRWYYGQDPNKIVYASNGNSVPKSEFAEPCGKLPKKFPADLNRQWYIDNAFDVLRSLGI